MAKKKFNPFVLLYVISGILLIISIAPIAVPREGILGMKKRVCLMILWKKIIQDLSKKLIIIKV